MQPNRGPNRGASPPPELPPDYLKTGYFDAAGNPRKELVTTVAQAVARSLRKAYPELTNSQMRQFYTHVRGIEYRLRQGRTFAELQAELHMLKPLAEERQKKDKVPELFSAFIRTNLAHVTDEKSFLKGFLLHFQAVLAFHYKKGEKGA